MIQASILYNFFGSKEMSICLPSLVWRKWNGFCPSWGVISSHEWPKFTSGWKWHRVWSKNHWIVFTNQWRWTWVFDYCHWCEENEMVFVSHEVSFPATSDRRSRVAGNGTECEVKTIELSSPTSGGEQWAFLNLHNFTAVKKTVPTLIKWILLFFR